MNKNNAIVGLIVLTGVFFATATLSSNAEIMTRATGLGIVTGISAIFTKLLVRDGNTNKENV